MTPQEVEQFQEHRPRLFSIAYRMLGTVADAEDLVQETFLRWQQSDRLLVQNPQGWLSTVVTRLSINQLNSARSRREEYVGPWLPEPLITAHSVDPGQNAKLVESLSMAFLILLEKLSPTERAVFLLREVFGYEFDEIAPVVEKTENNCRQILTRARKHLDEGKPRFECTGKQTEVVLQKFFQAVTTGDVQGLLSVLAPDSTAVTDGGGKGRAVFRPIIGAGRVLRFLLGTMRKFVPGDRVFRPAIINGQPGVIGYDQKRAVQVSAFGIADGRIGSIYIINNPEKLQHLSPLNDEK